MNGEHGPSVSRMIIPLAQICPDVQTLQIPQIFLINLPFAGPPLLIPGIKPVNVLAVNSHCAGHVFRLLHSPFNFKGINSGIDELRQDLQNTHIPHRNRIAPAVLSRRLSLLIPDLIWQAAGTGASAPVAASSS